MEQSLENQPIFGFDQATKSRRLFPAILALTHHHRQNCVEYRNILQSLRWTNAAIIEEIPWLPVRIFKHHVLRSVPSDQVFRRLTSSGTTGSDVSIIDLDRESAQRQAQMLSRTLQTVLGPERLPMLIVDSRAVTRGASFSARGAGVIGMMNFGRHHSFALDDNMELDLAEVRRFVSSYGDQPFLIFGFTFMVWKFLLAVADSKVEIDLTRGILIHSGGWKKLVDQAVNPETFRRVLKERTGLYQIHNYYGMVEQIGTIFLESEGGDGTFTCPSFADILIRDPLTFRQLGIGEIGLIQTISQLPTSYPGHSVLTEDLGRIIAVDDTSRLGLRFEVLGRLPRAEARGCSDTSSIA